MSAHRGRFVAALLVLPIAVLSACGAPASVSTAPTASSPARASAASVPPPTPTASDLVDAVSHTRGLGTAALAITVDTQVGDTTRSLVGTGASALDQGFGDLVWTAADGARSRELSNGRGLYVQVDVPDGRWIRLEDAAGTPTGALADPLRGLGGLQDVVDDGTESVGGSSTVRYAGVLPATPEAIALLGLSRDERAVVESAVGDAAIQVTVWVDDGGRVLRIDRLLQTPAGSAHTTTALSRFSDPIDLAPPPSGSVDPAPDSQ